MAIANLHETILMYTLRKSDLINEISSLQTQKTLASMNQGDARGLHHAKENSLKAYYKEIYQTNPDLQAKYKDYTEIPEFEDEMEKLQAMLDEQLDELKNWEVNINNQITTNSTELEEINAFLDSYKSMLTSNIQEDFNYGQN